MVESAIEPTTHTLERARTGFDSAKRNLFNSAISRTPQEIDANLRAVLESGASLAGKEEESRLGGQDLSLKQAANMKDRPKGPTEYRNQAVDYQDALAVLDGKRERPDSLSRVVGQLANEQYSQARVDCEESIKSAPIVLGGGMLSIIGKDHEAIARAHLAQSQAVAQIDRVLSFIEDKIKGSQTSDTQSQSRQAA